MPDAAVPITSTTAETAQAQSQTTAQSASTTAAPTTDASSATETSTGAEPSAPPSDSETPGDGEWTTVVTMTSSDEPWQGLDMTLLMSEPFTASGEAQLVLDMPDAGKLDGVIVAIIPADKVTDVTSLLDAIQERAGDPHAVDADRGRRGPGTAPMCLVDAVPGGAAWTLGVADAVRAPGADSPPVLGFSDKQPLSAPPTRVATPIWTDVELGKTSSAGGANERHG